MTTDLGVLFRAKFDVCVTGISDGFVEDLGVFGRAPCPSYVDVSSRPSAPFSPSFSPSIFLLSSSTFLCISGDIFSRSFLFFFSSSTSSSIDVDGFATAATDPSSVSIG